MAPLNSLSWQSRTPNLRQNWVTQSSCSSRMNDDNISHSKRPGTRSIIVICLENSHRLAATAAPLTYNCTSQDLKHHFFLCWVYKLHLSCYHNFPEEFTSTCDPFFYYYYYLFFNFSIYTKHSVISVCVCVCTDVWLEAVWTCWLCWHVCVLFIIAEVSSTQENSRVFL